MRDLLFIAVAGVIAYFSVQWMSGYVLPDGVRLKWFVPAVAAVFSATLVLLGESLVEDIVKSVIIVVLAAVMAKYGRNGSVFLYAALISVATGILFNGLNKMLEQRQRDQLRNV